MQRYPLYFKERSMKNMFKGLAAAVLVFAVATPVSAASFDLSFNTQNSGAQNSLTYSYNDGLDSLRVTGLSGQNGSSIFSSNVQTWNGWGMGMQGNRSHRVSNNFSNGQRVYQMVMFDFGRDVSLDSFTVGDSFRGNNNWASVLAFTDSGSLPTLTDLSWGQLLEKGFSTAGDDPNTYTGVANGKPKLVDGSLTSQYWLVGVYNAVFSDNPMHTYYEGFKLTGISFSTIEVSEVPLPAAAWLFLTGLAGMTWMKKRKQKRDQLQAA